MTYTTILGARQHSAANQQHVDRAVDVSSTAFKENHQITLTAGHAWRSENALRFTSPDQLRGYLANPRTVLLSSDAAVALVLKAGEIDQRLLVMWVEEKARGQGIGSALLKHIISAYTADHLMQLDCPAARENFYRRHGFHRLYSASGGAYVYMAGPGESESDVLHRLPEGHPARLQPQESLPWECPRCKSTNAATAERCCECGSAFTTH
jgi:GNAT superfamily N-acetyltransferase